MKRISRGFAFLLVLVLFLTGCDSSDYKKGMDLYNSGNYLDAAAIFEALGDYSDSKEMLLSCNYNEALNIYNAGKYTKALEIFSTMGEYSDTQNMILKCKYGQAVDTYDKKQFEESIVILSELGDYSDCKDILADCYIKLFDIAVEEHDYSSAVTSLRKYEPIAQDPDKIASCYNTLVIDYVLYKGKMLHSNVTNKDIGIAISKKNSDGCTAYIAVDSDSQNLKIGYINETGTSSLGLYNGMYFHFNLKEDPNEVYAENSFMMPLGNGSYIVELGATSITKSQINASYVFSSYLFLGGEKRDIYGKVTKYSNIKDSVFLSSDKPNTPSKQWMVEGICQLLKEIDSSLVPADIGLIGMNG